MIRYVFREGVPVILQNRDKADPQRIGEAVEKARQATPPGEDVRETLVRAARSKRHALNQHLLWDDAEAAHRYRLEQCNDLIRIVATEDKETGVQTPAFINLAASGVPRAFYSPEEIQRSEQLQEAALLSAERDLDAFTRRHRWLSDICEQVAGLREEVRRRRVGSPAEATAA